MSTLGIIDIGTNSIKLLIVKINKDKSYEGVFNKKFQIRLKKYIEIRCTFLYAEKEVYMGSSMGDRYCK